ncbi:MAG: hypothetical protein ABI168_05930 [Ginsengibacter sp.]
MKWSVGEASASVPRATPPAVSPIVDVERLICGTASPTFIEHLCCNLINTNWNLMK